MTSNTAQGSKTLHSWSSTQSSPTGQSSSKFPNFSVEKGWCKNHKLKQRFFRMPISGKVRVIS